MKVKLLFISVIISLSFGTTTRKFPEITYVNYKNEKFSNEDFLGKKTLVVLFHIGCPAAMTLLKDIQRLSLEDTRGFQIVGVLENTDKQIMLFNSDSINNWSETRIYYKLKPNVIPLFGECSDEKIVIDGNSKNIITQQCSILAEKLNTDYSPTLVYVNADGEIEKIKKGYVFQKPLEKRIKYLFSI